MSKKNNRIIGIVVALFALVAILVCFSTCFGDVDTDVGSAYGSVFQVIFGKKLNDGTVLYKPVGGLVAAFVIYCVTFVGAFIVSALSGKAGALGFGLIGVGMIVSGVLFLLSPSLFKSANPGALQTLYLGVGAIVTAVFAMLSGVVALYGAYKNFKD